MSVPAVEAAGVPDRAVFTTTQVARLLRVSTRTIMKLIDAGELRGYRIPGSTHRRVPREALLRFLVENEAGAALGLVPAKAGGAK